MFERDIMAIDFNTGKVNNTSSVNSNTVTTTFNTSVGSTAVEMTINNKTLKRLEKLGIVNPEDLYAILEKCQKENINIDSLSDEDLQKIVTEYNELKASKTIENSETVKADEEQPTEQTLQAESSSKNEEAAETVKKLDHCCPLKIAKRSLK